jgi:hypothetical protein
MNEKLILAEWGRIQRAQRRIEQLRMTIGQLKDNILLAEQEIIKLQGEDVKEKSV